MGLVPAGPLGGLLEHIGSIPLPGHHLWRVGARAGCLAQVESSVHTLRGHQRPGGRGLVKSRWPGRPQFLVQWVWVGLRICAPGTVQVLLGETGVSWAASALQVWGWRGRFSGHQDRPPEPQLSVLGPSGQASCDPHRLVLQTLGKGSPGWGCVWFLMCRHLFSAKSPPPHPTTPRTLLGRLSGAPAFLPHGALVDLLSVPMPLRLQGLSRFGV